MGLRIETFKPEHIKQVNARIPDKEWADSLAKNDGFYENFETYVGPAFTAFLDDKAIACAGVVIFWQGFGEAWLYTGIEIEDYKIWFHKTVKKYLWEIIKNMNLIRVQIAVDANYLRANRWAESLGFIKESEMRNFGTRGETFIRYVILDGGQYENCIKGNAKASTAN